MTSLFVLYEKWARKFKKCGVINFLYKGLKIYLIPSQFRLKPNLHDHLKTVCSGKLHFCSKVSCQDLKTSDLKLTSSISSSSK